MTVEPTIVVEVKTRQMEDNFYKKIAEEIDTKLRSGYTIEKQVLKFEGRLCVADIPELKRKILQEAHGSKFAVHPGNTKMRESKFIQKIVKVIEDKLNRKILSDAPSLIGMHSRVTSINSWLQDESTNAGVLVICGMGGIGKTTIAKFVYNLNYRRFESSCFLANIREVSKQPNGLVRLQRQLLSEISKRKKENIHNVDEGNIKIMEAMSCKRVLIVLDDVDQLDQLDAVIGIQDWLHPGSKIMITSRHERLMQAHKAHEVYKVENFDEAESFELFSWHAFGQNHPMEGFIEHSKRVVQYCGGLPLALQVLGSSLSGKSVHVWESALEKLDAIPESQIVKKLKISYDSLQDDHDKNLFLHIACFFVGKDKDCLTRILDECDFYTTIGIQNLIDRCLVTIDKSNKLMMHQLLRDMGREIIRHESPREPGKRSRLWHRKDSFNVLREKTGTETIEGLALDMHMSRESKSSKSILRANTSNLHHFKEYFFGKSSLDRENALNRHHFGFLSSHPTSTEQRNANDVGFKTDAFARMQKLRLLQLNYVQLNGSCAEFPKGLSWLCWRGFPSKFIPKDFPLDSLVELDMRYSHLERVWKGTKFLGLLKTLNLSHSHSLAKTPDFSLLPNLERLILKDCTSLFKIHKSIGNLERLALLNAKDCKQLRKLPRNIVMVKSLEKLIISGCSNLDKLPPDMGKMESLKVLYADGIAIDQLLSTIGEVKPWHAFVCPMLPKPRKTLEISWVSLPQFLVNLSLVDCNLSDDAFPRDFNNLPLLQNLNLSKNPICTLPDCIKDLSRLQTLRLNSCTRLQSLLGLQSVENLFVGHCTSLEKITYQSNMFRSQIEHTKCDKLVEVQGLFKLQPVGKVEMEMIKNLGLFNLEAMPIHTEVCILSGTSLNIAKHPIQGLYEFGVVFNTFFPGREVPGWYSNKSTGSSISFILPSLHNLTIRGLNVCLVYAIFYDEEDNRASHGNDHQPFLRIEISTRSKSLNLKYNPICIGVPETNEDMIWLSHWSIGNQLEGGDEVNASVTMRTVFELKEFGVDVVYEEEQKQAGAQDKAYPFNCPKSLRVVRTYIVSNPVSSKDYVLAPLSCSSWHKYVLQVYTETTGFFHAL
ncbi:disease resistance protein RML1A-like [Camellia sinensis]|uniref:disease resistance protein RML1A-like n=1 Tax=Camellia sinensis TaxID=4442 RepID=UPI0010361E2C|nr:disease resistance protein RML1A-like [Camellia sinensis]